MRKKDKTDLASPLKNFCGINSLLYTIFTKISAKFLRPMIMQSLSFSEELKKKMQQKPSEVMFEAGMKGERSCRKDREAPCVLVLDFTTHFKTFFKGGLS